ncbi:MAG: hypothetical protein GVX96_05075 [Bacteroidetes bacterium]|jgi:hypothetical protein|nr:hypothetical protein [Bacteroidota bacterium]
MNKIINHFLVLILLTVLGCQDSTTSDSDDSEREKAEVEIDPLFVKLEEKETGIGFTNVLHETPEFNYYTYTYLYNGSGVAVADFNNDGLKDLFFVGAMSSNKLFINEGGLKFKDITAGAGVEGPNVLKTGVAVHDVNEDGYLDIYVCHSGQGPLQTRTNALYINNRDGTFSEQAIERGLDDQSNTNHALFFDYDNDNDLDLFLLNHPLDFNLINNMSLKQLEDGTILRDAKPDNSAEADRLFENIGEGQYREVSQKAGIYQKAYGLSVTPMDINTDGNMDLYVGNDFIEPDFMYINQGDGTFLDSIDAYFPHMSNNTMGADAADVNNDGRLDFMSLDMLPETHYRQKTLLTSMRYDRYKQLEKYNYGSQLMHNTLFIKGKDDKMRDMSCYAGVDATDWSWSPLIADFDGDGWKDIFVTNGYRRDLTDLDFMNYYDQNVSNPSLPWEKVQDLLDEVPSVPVPNYMYRNQGDYTFSSIAEAWGLGESVFSNGALSADLDADGDLDLVVNNFDMPTFIYENRAKQLNNHNYLHINLKGPKGNPEGIGADIRLFHGEQMQYQNVQRCKGFMSYSAATAHFGLGEESQVDSVVVRWPDGRTNSQPSIPSNQQIEINYADADKNDWSNLSSAVAFFENIEQLDFVHTENDFIDLKREPLLPKALSRRGPVLEVLDFNQDGLDDVFIGGARGQASALFVQQSDGNFKSILTDFFESSIDYEDVALAIADISGNGFPDIYVGSGGYSEREGSPAYRDRLYLNQEGINLKLAQLPPKAFHTGAAAAGDFNGDGHPDIFVGSSSIPNQYPRAERSLILLNEDGKLREAGDAIWSGSAPESMVHTALAADFTDDGKTDLLLAGEWMPITLYPQNNNELGKPIILPDSEGWWNRLHACQFQADGKTKILAGNFGRNTRWRASPEQPIEVFAADFDNSGRHTPIMTHYMDGERVPVPQRGTLMELMPSLRTDYVKFSTYAEAKIEDLIDIKRQSHTYGVTKNLGSGYVEIDKDGFGDWKAFPAQIQWSEVHAFETTDLTGNGLTDIIIGGNNFELEIESARIDALTLAVLIQREKGQWEFIPQAGTLNRFNRELRSMKMLSIRNEPHLIIGWKEHPIEILKVKSNSK